MKKYAIILMTFLYVQLCFGQIGSWRAYMAYSDIQQIVKANDYLFVRASNSLYQYNLTDHSIVTYDKVNGLSDTYITHIAWNQKAKRLIAVYNNSNIDLIDVNGDVTNVSALYRKTMTDDKTIDSLTIDDVYAYLYARFGIVKVNMQRAEIADTYTKNHPEYPTSLPSIDYTADFNTYLPVVKTLKPGGPKYNYFYESKFVNRKLYTTAGYFLSGVGDFNYPGIVQVWDGYEWQNYQENIDSITGFSYLDNNCIDVDPTNENRTAVGGRCGLYIFENGKLTNYYNQQNSPLHGADYNGSALGYDYTLINGLKYDSKGNLWVLNSQARGVNLFELTKDGEWNSHFQSLLAGSDNVAFVGLRQTFIDSRDLLWFVNTNWDTPALFCYDMENDHLVRYDKFINQDGAQYEVTYVYCVNEDIEGNIWMGTNQGPFMILKNEVGQESITLQQVKVPRNDGSDYADYLLSGIPISSIAIDGGGRKWFCSNTTGAFLVSADNMTQLQHFTSDNSKLLSDKITSVSIDNQTGEVFFLTDNGLCSYISDATQPNTEMNKDNVYAYPNPITSDYTGIITIVGLSLNADVKICSSSGKVIAEGRSNGGSFTWDGCDQEGRRVASGVYMVITATSDGKKGTVCKIAVIK